MHCDLLLYHYDRACLYIQVVWQHAPEELSYLEELTTTLQWVEEYRAFRVHSSYTITADRRINQQMYRCSLHGNPKAGAKILLKVKC